jgi:hypothetical protein
MLIAETGNKQQITGIGEQAAENRQRRTGSDVRGVGPTV